jgi:uncharacterized protein (DUF58 family)
MLTQRGWWLVLTIAGLLVIGAWSGFALLGRLALAFLAWFAFEWLRFAISVRATAPGLAIDRQVRDERGDVTTLWAGRNFVVEVNLRSKPRRPALSFVVADDAVPFEVEKIAGEVSAAGALRRRGPLTFSYRIHCRAAGLARFEGVRVRIADLHGLFYHETFVRSPVVYRVLPVLVDRRATLALTKRVNQLPPPGVHRLRRPGSGSELLDLRDYLPGDPPKTIAWKVSARRDRLITKEFESEVPIRCTLFVDTSASVRVPALAPPVTENDETWRSVRPLDRLVEIAAGVVQANSAKRDLTVLYTFDEDGATVLRPDRTGPRLTQMLHRLADAAALDPTAARVDPTGLIPLASTFASQVYPDLLSPRLNSMPSRLAWFGTFPWRGRRRLGFFARLHRARISVFVGLLAAIPLLCVLAYAVVLIAVIFSHQPQNVLAKAIARGLLLTAGVSTISIACAIIFLAAATALGASVRRTQAWRKRLAALFNVLYGPAPGGAAALLEDDDRFALQIQRFLGEHRVPYSLPLYGADGRYMFASAEKIPVLAKALVQAVGRGRDNELFVLLADVLELDRDLRPLLGAVRTALGRHHQVLLVCPWPPAIPLPGGESPENSPTQIHPAAPGTKPLPRRMAPLTVYRFHAAYRRARLTFGRIGVQIVCAASDQPLSLILDRIERLRRLRRVH